jgi:tRNA nucleotidyltransferase (CCA-adding enzyme)
MPDRELHIDELRKAVRQAYPELDAFAPPGGKGVYLVGGAVRDLLLGRGRADLDLVVVGDAAALADAMGALSLVEHQRFGTAKVELEGHEIDIAAARTETYSHPGALPTIWPAPDIETDLTRRDFTVNAMAIPLGEQARLIDPYDGVADLEAGLLRVLHADSFVDDPTRAIRAARYAARFGFELERRTGELLRATDLEIVSGDRRWSELARLAAEETSPRGFQLLSDWGLITLREGGAELVSAVSELLKQDGWRGEVYRPEAILSAALGPAGGELELAAAKPRLPSEGVELARGRSMAELALARALGAEWLDTYLSSWRWVRLEIDGADLIAAGVPEGPALGRGLAAALRGRLDGEFGGREAELAAALAAAGVS